MLSTSIPAFSVSAEEASETVTTETSQEQSTQSQTQETTAEETTQAASEEENSLESSQIDEYSAEETTEVEEAVEIISGKIDSNRIQVTGASSEANGSSGQAIGYGGEKENVLDGDLNTMWHTAWNINEQEKYITFEFNDVVKLTKIKYVRRAYDEDNGTFLNYTVYTKNTEEGEWKASATGAWTWSNPNREQIIEFITPVEAKYVKLVANKTVKDNNFASASEIEFYENIATRPEITSQPKGGYSDSDITLSVTATSDGAELNYQWYENNENSLFGATEIAEATSSSYVVNLEHGQKKYYFVKVTNTKTGISIISDIVMAGHGTAAAMVNGTAYSDLASAIQAATSGSVVYVLRDQEISSTILISKNITIEAEAGTTVVLKRSQSFTGDFMFKVQSGANFNVSRTASGKVIIDGENIASAYGAVKVENGRFYLNSNGVIRNNNSTSNGAAVYTSAGGNSQIHIYGTIKGNHTDVDGGAICSNGFTYVYASSEISNNHAEYNAGAIYNYSGGVASISGGNHFGNTAVGNGGFFWADGKTTISGGTITGNSAAYGGGIYGQNGANSSARILELTGGTVSGNTATTSGNDIYTSTNHVSFRGNITVGDIYIPNGKSLIVNGAITGSVGFSYGGEPATDGTTVFTGSGYTIKATDAEKIKSVDEKMVSEFVNSKVVVKYAPVKINTQPQSIEKVSMNEPASLSIEAESLTGTEVHYQWYECEDAEGNNPTAIEDATNAQYNPDTNVEGTFYYYCEVSADKAQNSISDIVAVRVVNDSLSEIPMIVSQPQGGTYDIRQQAALSVEAKVTDNGTLSYQWYVAKDGESEGELLTGKNTAIISVDNEVSGTYYYYCVVTNKSGNKEARSAESDRAEIVVTDAVAAFDGVKYSNFSEAITALKAASYDGTLEIYKDVTLTETINVNSGVNLTVTATPVDGVVPRIVLANNFGNEAFVVNGGNLIVNNVAIDGGAIWVKNGMYYEEYLGRGSRNTGRSSGKPLINITGGGTVTLNGSASLQNNVANGISGGAVVMTNGTFNMNDNSQIKDNYASSHGGALYSSSSNSRINITGNSVVSGNQGGSSTGGICADTGTILNISGGVIEKNFTGGRAGGMFTNGTFNMTGGEIRNNYSGTNGGGMIVNGGTTKISGGSISGNTSGSFGGGISSLVGTVTISDNAVISNNYAGTNGGGIAATGGNLVVNGGRFSGNSAVGNGGAIYRSTDNGTGRIDADFTKITFENNKSVVTGENGGTLSNVYVTRSTNLGNIIANATNDEAFYNAIYFEHTFVVTLNTGIDGETVAESVRFMGQYDLPELKRNGYKFLGWFDAAEGGNKVEDGACVVTKSNHSLYAQWERTATDTITITEQPTGGVMYKEDENVLSVTAEIASDNDGIIIDEILNYQWYEIDSETNKPVEITGETSSSITLNTNDRELGIYNFFCIVSGGNAADVKSETARVELISKDVAATPTFNTQPNNVDCFVGDDAVFTANATTVDLGTVTYQWYRSTDNVVSPETDEAIAGATEASYCENTSKAGTYYYYVIATNTITDTKGETVTSNAVSNVAKLVCHNRITVSTVSSNDVVMTPAYWDKYAVGYKTTSSADGYIGNVASCYGSYGNNTVEKAFDGNWNTFWETNRGGVNNYLEFTFVDSVKVDRILYATRQDGYKGRGYPTTLTIYMAEDEQNYVEVGVAKSSENSGYVMFTLPETIEFKGKMRFEFTSSTFGNWASASELILLRDESTVLDGRATISGNAVPGQTLTANVYDSNAVDFTYQWQYSEDGTTFANIEGATESTYTIKDNDKDGYLRVVLRDKSKTYSGTIISSSYKGLFEAHLDGQGVIGTTLTAKTNYTAENASFKYVWQRKSAEGDYVNIEFQDYSSTYNISVFDINSYIRVGIKYDDSSNAKNDVTDLSGYVFSEPVFVDVQAIMTGVPQVGSVLTASLSGYKESVHYQWQVCDTEDGEFTDIAGAAYSEFTITEEYLNKYIRVAITVTESSRELVSVAWQVAEAGTYPEASGDHIYVTDMPKANLITSSVGYGGSVKYDTNISGGTISLKVDGERKYFMKGLGAHAAANMVYDVSDYVKYYHYNRFIAYLGLDFSQGSNGDGVIFKIYTAETYDGNNTVWKNVKTTGVLKGTSEAVYVDLDLTGVNYIKIEIGANWNNASDHSVVADAMLATVDYEPIDTSEFINRVEYYDEKLKAYEAEHPGTSYTELLKDEEYELLFLQRTFVSNATYAVLSSFLFNDENIETLQWFMNDIEALRLYIGGGKPDGSYTRSLNVLKNLYIKHKADLADPVNGSLYKKMMITLSLTHSADVYFWQDSSQKSDPVRRYEIYKKLYDNELLITDVFKNLEVEEMRWVMNNIISDDQIEWLNYYVRYHTNIGNKEINKNNYTPGPYYFITYTMGFNYNQPQFYDPKKQASWEEEWKLDNQYLGTGILSNNVQDQEKIKVYDIDVEYGKVKLWVVFEAGAVCGGISKTGSNLNTVFGIPSVVIGQPGHAAYLQFATTSDNTTGTWGIHNDISGWTGSEKGERMLNGWGSYSWDSAYQVSYVLLAQAALNQPDKYYEAEKLIKIADMYKDDPEKRIEIYREALNVQNINLDAWIALIDAYKQAGKSPSEFSQLAVEISDALTYYPLPMWDVLERLIKPNVRGEEKFLGEVSSCQTMALTRAKNATSADTLQDSACRTMANHLLGNNNFKMATFSFDGDKANTIVLNDMYSGGNEVLICLNGNPSDSSSASWINLGTGKEFKLTDEQLAMITPEKDIHVRLQGTTSYYTIDITAGSLPSGLYRNDNENRITGNTANLEYKISGETEWHDMTSDVRFNGDVTISVRKKAAGTSLQSGETEFTFTYDKDSDNRKYIPLNRVEYIGCSSEQVDKSGSAKNALDGNINTYWHTWWAGGDNDRYIIVKLDEPVYLTGFDYTPVQSGNGNGRFQTCEIYTSLTGEDGSWTLSGRATGWGNNANKKSLELYNPVYTQYIKVRGAQAVGNFGSASMLEFFEDTTVENKAIESIAITTKPDRTEYVVGDELDTTGLEVMATFDDGTQSIISNSLLKFSPTIFDSIGEKTITVTSSQNSAATAEFTVNVSENTKVVSDIFVSHLPEKTRYFVGDNIVTDGLVVKANYTDGSQGYLFDNQYTVAPNTFTENGSEIPVTVTYTADETKTATFNVEVTKNVKNIIVSQVPEKAIYYLGDALDTTGIAVSVEYTDGTVEELESYDYIVKSSGFSNTSGTKKITVEYQRLADISTTFSVLVYPYITYNGLRYESVDNEYKCYVSGVADELEPNSVVTVPSTVKVGDLEFTVIGISKDSANATGAFENQTDIIGINLPATVTDIKADAFKGCTNLKEIYLNEHTDFANLVVENGAFANDENNRGKIYVATDAYATELNRLIAAGGNVEGLKYFTAESVTNNIVSINVTLPEKLDYHLGESLDLTGMKVIGVTTDGQEIELADSLYTVSDLDSTTAGNKNITVTLNNTVIEYTFPVRVIPATPEITKQPVGNVYATGADKDALTVEATISDEGTLSYQWYLNTTDSTQGAQKIDGATASTYKPTNDVKTFYYVVVSNNDSNGNENTAISVTSDIVCVDVGNYTAKIDGVGYSTLHEAVTAAEDGDRIEILKNINLDSSITINKSITLSGMQVKRTSNTRNVPLFQITAGNVVFENITIDGGAIWDLNYDGVLERNVHNGGISSQETMVLVTGGSLTLSDNAVLQNNCNDNYSNSFGSAMRISNDNTKVIIDGGAIINNYEKRFGGAIYMNNISYLTMNDGRISGNQSGDVGGAICVDNSSVFVMNGGSINNNNGQSNGGVVWLSNGSATFNGGTVKNNKTNGTGNVYMNGSGTVNIGNVTMSGNIANGGTAVHNNNGTVKITGKPSLSDNTIYLPSGKAISVQANLAGADKIFVTGANMTAGRVIANVSNTEFVKAAAETLIVGDFVSRADGNNVVIQTTVELEWSKNLPVNKTIFAGTQLELEVEATGGSNITYKWYICDDAQGTNPREINTTSSEPNKLIYGDCNEGVCYFYCVASVNDGVSEDIQSEIVTVNVVKFVPCSQAIEKFLSV